jgi:4-carboxymuconolactone decarboxylase
MPSTHLPLPGPLDPTSLRRPPFPRQFRPHAARRYRRDSKAKAAITKPNISSPYETRKQSSDQIPPGEKRFLSVGHLRRLRADAGHCAFILRVMARRPEFMIFSSLKDFYALRAGSLDARTAELLAVAAAAGAGADKCLRVHMAVAERAGAIADEILDAVFIAAVIGQTRVLASSLRIFQDFGAGLKKKQEK